MNQQTRSFELDQSESTAFAQSPDAAIYTHPDDVVGDPRLTLSEKRAVLASWLSDARAVENAPGLRRLDSGAIIEFDVIQRSLNALETPEWRRTDFRERTSPAHRRRSVISRLLSRVAPPSRSDDDDDPPPAPAGLRAPFRPTFVMADGARPERLRACAIG